MQSKSLKVLVVLLCIVAACALGYFFLPTLLSALAPFIIAYILSLALEPLIRLLNEKLRMPRPIAACICTVLAVGIIGVLVSWIGVKLWAQIVELVDKWPEIYEATKNYVMQVFTGLQSYYDSLSPQMQAYITYGLEEARAGVTSLISPVANWLVYFARGLVAGVPSAIIFVIVTCLACNFMCAEKKKMRALFSRVFGAKTINRAATIWRDLKSALGGYIKAQLSIMCVSSIILLIGFSLARVPFALLLAVSVAILDGLPVFGSGAVLIPWSLIALIHGDFMTLAIMLSMYLIIIVTRQILEPRILGKHIGVPPLLTLMSMYIGLKFIGIFGMVIGPVIVLVVKNLYIGGVFDRLLKKEEKIETKKVPATVQETQTQEETVLSEETKPEDEVQNNE